VPRVLLLLPTSTYKAADFLAAAERLGVEPVVGSEHRQALEGIAPGRTVTLPLSDPEAAAHAIARFARDRPLKAVLPTDDATAEVAARAAVLLGLPHNPPEAARAARRKDRMRALLQAAGVRAPRHRLLSCRPSPGDGALAALAGAQDYPCVLKPTFLAASRGVIRADDPAAFAVAFRRIEALLRRDDVIERGDDEALGRILVEEYIAGDELALEGLLHDGRFKVLALFDKPDPLVGPFFEETLYITPSRRPAAEQQAVAAAVAAAARALGLREGPVHAEARLDAQGPSILEVAARSIGGLCARALRFGAGLSLEELLILHALGREVETLEREPRAAGVMMLPIPRAGLLVAVDGAAAARAVPGIEDLVVSATLGQPVEPLPEGHAYLGFLFARGDTPGTVEAALREAHRRLSIVIEPAGVQGGERVTTGAEPPILAPSGAVAPGGAAQLRDRGGFLVFLGVVEIALGALFAALGLLMLVTASMTLRAGAGAPTAQRMVLGANLVIDLGSAAFMVVIGIGTMKVRRWARVLMLIVSWSFLAAAILGVAMMVALLPGILAGIDPGSTDPAMVRGVAAIVMAIVGGAMIALPLFFILAYNGRHVRHTFATRHPQPGWIDRCPTSVLALSLVMALFGLIQIAGSWAGLSVLFGVALAGPAAVVVNLALGAAWMTLALGLFRLNRAAWLASFAFTAIIHVSAYFAYRSTSFLELTYRLGMGAGDAAVVAGMAPFIERWSGAVALGCWVAWVISLLAVRRHFTVRNK